MTEKPIKVVRCEDCKNCMGHTCDVFLTDKDLAIVECFKDNFKSYEEKTEKIIAGINFSGSRRM